jgi:hypothetical protein
MVVTPFAPLPTSKAVIRLVRGTRVGSDVLGIVWDSLCSGSPSRTARNPEAIRRKVRSLQEQRFQRRGIPVSDTLIERRVRAGVFAA